MAAARQAVVARYNEDVSWAKALDAEVLVYNKGEEMSGCPFPVAGMQNVGHEAHTYLHHIVTRWDDLAEMTLFTQGRLGDHYGGDPNDFFRHGQAFVCPRVLRCRDWGADGRLSHHGKWKAALESGAMGRAKGTLPEWFEAHFLWDVTPWPWLHYAVGSVFAVPRTWVRSRPKRLYEGLWRSLAWHREPEEAHYMERSWLYLFAPTGWGPVVSLLDLSRP